MFVFRWNCVFRTEVIHDLHYIFYCTIQITCVSFLKKIVVCSCNMLFYYYYYFFFRNIYNFVRQHYVDLQTTITKLFECFDVHHNTNK